MATIFHCKSGSRSRFVVFMCEINAADARIIRIQVEHHPLFHKAFCRMQLIGRNRTNMKVRSQADFQPDTITGQVFNQLGIFY